MSEFVKLVNVIGLHGQFDFFCEFQEGVNVIYGKNGTGKTTLLHIIANVLNRDFIRFVALEFKQIRVELSNGESLTIELERISKSGRLDRIYRPNHYHYDIVVNGKKINEKEICPLSLDKYRNRGIGRISREEEDDTTHLNFPNVSLSSAYFPAFRTAIDAWAINQEENSKVRRYRNTEKTGFARSLFGQFVPRLDYPATTEIEQDLNEKIRTAIAKVSQADRTYFGNVPSKILEALSSKADSQSNTNSIFQDIEELSKKFQEYPIQVESISSNLNDSIQSVPDDEDSKRIASLVLNAYKEALHEIVIVQEESFAEVERYLKSVNIFLENKNLKISQIDSLPSSMATKKMRSPSIVVQFEGKNSRPMSMSQSLSSGERQIVTLIYATTRMSQQDVVLVDEPEISLNVDWQRKLLPEMVRQMPSKQLIVCTHSPIVGSKYRDRMIELKLSQTSQLNATQIELLDDLEDPYDDLQNLYTEE
jgi:ABC-type lipoprotein export system ATPase subunit